MPFPLQSISISDFRRLDGRRTIPLDAPIVLLHGPNGSGKTSVLSAIELALTGEIRSMRRHDPRYTAYLPSHGHSFATLRAELSEPWARPDTRPMTVGGDSVDGPPALNPAAAQFFAERCFLDQASLGRLLEIYQHREAKQESALERFVNELLGLDDLDALRAGLSDTTDVRSLRKLCPGFADAERRAAALDEQLASVTKRLGTAQSQCAAALADLAQAMRLPGRPDGNSEPAAVVRAVEQILSEADPSSQLAAIERLSTQLTALGGRISGLQARPSAIRLSAARDAVAAAEALLQQWRLAHERPVAEWRAAYEALGLMGRAEAAAALDEELRELDARAAERVVVSEEARLTANQIAAHESRLAAIDGEIAQLQHEAGAFAAALASMRSHVVGEICPVCSRDFAEVDSGALADHVEHKIIELTDVGARLTTLGELKELETIALREAQLAAQVLDARRSREFDDRALADRRREVIRVRTMLDAVASAIAEGAECDSRLASAIRALEDMQSAETDDAQVRSSLAEIAQQIAEAAPRSDQPIEVAWQALRDTVAERLRVVLDRQHQHALSRAMLAKVTELSTLIDGLRREVSEIAQHKLRCETEVSEAQRRHHAAKQVHSAANAAREAIVRRVFTESLNDVWRSVFTRLSPREPFVPAFGLPKSTRSALKIELETVHASGATGGAPQTMLSAGNLNTAALSLFIALHLAVDPLVPCLVFDDPVQSMDEVHIAQFACLIRVLSKVHDRQVVVAVHERELFEYLALELSPAYEQDELITVELGVRADDDDRGITRFRWTPDAAIAV
jgi:DNA repair protein SbcC/Rad50